MIHADTSAPLPVPSVAETDAVRRWLAEFEAALHAGIPTALLALFEADSHWRDLLAFTGGITPHRGADAIADALCRAQEATAARGFAIAARRTPPRRVRRLGRDVIEAIVAFETAAGRCAGVVRLPAEAPTRA